MDQQFNSESDDSIDKEQLAEELKSDDELKEEEIDYDMIQEAMKEEDSEED